MATLKISDLSVGDWVYYKGKECTIASIYMAAEGYPHEVALTYQGICCGGAYIDHLEPVPITAEILEKNGFERPDKKVYMDTWSWTNKEDTMIEVAMYKDKAYIRVARFEDGIQRDRDCNFGLKYIHQLQHALRIAGIDKDINL